jgi:hypothetical protein
VKQAAPVIAQSRMVRGPAGDLKPCLHAIPKTKKYTLATSINNNKKNA